MTFPPTKKVLCFCVPALLVAIFVRVRLMHDAPLACFNEDLYDFLKTALSLQKDSGFEIHEKKTVFLPLLYSAIAGLHLPVLGVVPIVQHLLGCAQVLLYGLIIAPLVRFWKVFVPLLTILCAINPSFLFFEHFMWAEAFYLFFIIALAATGVWYAAARTRASAICMAVAFLFVALTRPEGRFFILFPVLLLALNEWRQPLRLAGFLTPIFLAMLIVMFTSHGDEGGRLLYSSVLHLTPDHLRTAPGFETVIAPMKAQAVRDWEKYDSDGLQIPPTRQMHVSEALAKVTGSYLHLEGVPAAEQFRLESKLCFRIGVETCLQHPVAALGVLIKKAASPINYLPGSQLDKKVARGKELRLFARFQRISPAIFQLLINRQFHSEAEALAFARGHYPAEVAWFNKLHDNWRKGIRKFSFPCKKWRFDHVVWPPIPQIYTIAFVGFCIAAVRKSPFQTWHISMGITLALIAAMIFLTGNVRPRFRLFLEPFWLLYLGILCDFIATKIVTFRRQPAIK